MFTQFRLFSLLRWVTLITLLFLGGAVFSVQARPGESFAAAPDPTAALVNPNGTLDLTSGFRGTLDLTNWQVTLDQQRGPMLTPLASSWSGLGYGLSSGMYTILVDGSDVYVGGYITAICGNETCNSGNIPVNGIARWDGNAWHTLGHGLNSAVASLAMSASGDLYAGGLFTEICGNPACTSGNTPARHIAIWNGSAWSTFGFGFSGYLVAIALSPNGTLYAGGLFSEACGNLNCDSDNTTVNNIARWSGNTWIPVDFGLNDVVHTMAFSENNLIVGGEFSEICASQFCGSDSIQVNYVAQWNGSAWSALGNGLNEEVRVLITQGSRIVAGGLFTEVCGNITCDNNNTPVNHLAEWNGTAWIPLGFGVNDIAHALAFSPDGDLFAGGSFTQLCGNDLCNSGNVAVNYIARWDGSGWSSLSDGLSAIVVAMATGGSELIAGGGFVYACGDPTCTTGNVRVNLIAQIPIASRAPILIVPGIAGSYAADQDNDYDWLMQRGFHPDGLTVDPLGHFYDDLILTLENLGYVQGQDLFVVNYDWRLPPGPLDGAIDGRVDGLSGATISDESFLYGVDYLGYALRQAAEAWEQTHSTPLEKVHVIAHSTGGLVARTYIQSDAYGDLYDDTHHLPEIEHFIMIGVPNRGASKPWNPLQDNWIADPAYRMLLSKILDRAFQKVVAGQTITGPDYDITLTSILNAQNQPDPVAFIELYVPTLHALLATYDFFSDGGPYHDLNADPQQRNTWVLDLNNGLDMDGMPPADPNAFADLCTLTVIYGTSEDTKWLTRQLTGPAADVLAPFSDFLTSNAAAGETYYLDINGSANGDGTVPTLSAAGQFFGDPRVTLVPMAYGDNTNFPTDHTALVGNLDVQIAILDRLGISYDLGDIHLGAGASLASVLSVISDPVDIIVQDGLGRRLGYTAATGKLEEIPGSVWFGDAEGAGWLLGEVVWPLQVTLFGLGEPHYVHVAVNTPSFQGGWIDAGLLPAGETITYTIQGPSVFLPLVIR